MNIQTIIRQYPDQESCLKFLENIRWNGQIECPYCQSTHITIRSEGGRHHCNGCNNSFSVTVGTVLHDTKIELQTWFIALILILHAKKGISSRQLARDLGINRNSAWYLQKRVRKAMAEGDPILQDMQNRELFEAKLSESKEKRPVLRELIARGQVLSEALENKYGKIVKLPFSPHNPSKRDRKSMLTVVSNAKPEVTTDFRKQYIDQLFSTIYGKGYWTLLPRGMAGQYHRVSAKYFHAYIDELAFKRRYKNEEIAFFELIHRLMKRSSANKYDMDKRLAIAS